MTLYMPTAVRSGAEELASDLVRFGEERPPSQGAMLRLAGAQLRFEIGDVEGGCAVITDLFAEDPNVAGAAAVSLGRSDSGDLAMRCLDDLVE
jgi:hypothetical protein